MAKFNLGKIKISESVQEKLDAECIQSGLKRHADGDWGHSPKINAFQNEQVVTTGGPGMILSQYHDSNGEEFWIATDTLRGETSVVIPNKE